MNYQRILVLTELGVDPHVTFTAAGETESELRAIRRCTHTGHPLGTGEEVAQTCFLGLLLFPRGCWSNRENPSRPKNQVCVPSPHKREAENPTRRQDRKKGRRRTGSKGTLAAQKHENVPSVPGSGFRVASRFLPPHTARQSVVGCYSPHQTSLDRHFLAVVK
jgi:hypothetical protein